MAALKKFETGAVRSTDAESTRYDLITPIGLRRLAETYAEGAQKYGDHNWLKGIPAHDLLNHLEKHINDWKAGLGGEDHLAHAAWGLFALMHFEETRPELIDVPARNKDVVTKNNPPQLPAPPKADRRIRPEHHRTDRKK